MKSNHFLHVKSKLFGTLPLVGSHHLSPPTTTAGIPLSITKGPTATKSTAEGHTATESRATAPGVTPLLRAALPPPPIKSSTHHLWGQLRCHEPYHRGPHHQGTKTTSPRMFAESLIIAKGNTAAGSSSVALYPPPHPKARKSGARPLHKVVVQQ